MKLSSVKYAALCLTHNCNLRCRYCYAGHKTDRSMTPAVARQAIDFLARQAEPRCVVTFFGGEPLLQFDLLRDTVLYSRETYDRRVEFRMSTNGTLLTSDILSFLKEYHVYFVLSIDGHQKQHDCCRQFADGSGSYQSVADKLDAVFAVNPYTIAVSVLVPDTVDHLASGVIDLFDRRFRYVLQTLDYSAPWKSRHLRRMKNEYARLGDFYFDRMVRGDKIYYSPFDERIKTWAQKPYDKGDLCDLANSQIAVAPSGRIYPCVQFIGTDDAWHSENAIGDVTSGFDANRRLYYVEQNYREKASCSGCALKGRCATYCGCINWRATGHLDRVPPIICEHERMLMPIVDRTANRLWKKNVELFKRKFYDKSFPVSSYIEDCLIGGGEHTAANQTG